MRPLRFLLIAVLAPVGALLGVDAAADIIRGILGERPGPLGLVLVVAIGAAAFLVFRHIAASLADSVGFVRFWVARRSRTFAPAGVRAPEEDVDGVLRRRDPDR